MTATFLMETILSMCSKDCAEDLEELRCQDDESKCSTGCDEGEVLRLMRSAEFDLET